MNQTALAATRDFFKDKQTCKTFIASVPCCIRNNNEDFSKSVQLRSADARPRRDELEISNDEVFFQSRGGFSFFSFLKFFVRTGADRSHATAPRLLVAEDKTRSAIISFCAYELV